MIACQVKKQRAFTIIEMVVAIVVGAIIAIGIVDYIGRSVEGIDAAANRNQLASAGRTAIDRMAMELHNALPNSIRTAYVSDTDQCIEFVPIIGATVYIDPPFTGAGGTTFDVVQFDPDLNGTTSGYAVIYPSLASEIYDGNNGAPGLWPNFPTRGPIERISSIASGGTNISTITLFKTHRFNRRSPSERIYVVSDPVSFCIKSDKLYRYTNYGFFDLQTTVEEQVTICEVASSDRCLPNYSATPDRVLITQNIDNTSLTAFNVSPQALNRNALVSINLNFSSEGSSVRLSHEVLSRSVP
jgi:MSHA biogenesis protein MshO